MPDVLSFFSACSGRLLRGLEAFSCFGLTSPFWLDVKHVEHKQQQSRSFKQFE